MSIIIEGPDNSGKSTLAKHIARSNQLIQESEGPPKWRGEITERIDKYDAFPDDTIFVRHPAVSNPIYDEMRPIHLKDPISLHTLATFYGQSHLFIYCDPLNRGMSGHVVKGPAVETQDHIQRLNLHRDMIITLYRKWAVHHAHVIYRIGDDMEFIKGIVYDWPILQTARRNAEFVRPLLENKT